MNALTHTLEDVGYEVMGFTSATAALAVLREKRFDVVLTDLMMPEMDGIHFLRAAQALDQQLIGIVMTGHGAVDTAIEAMKAGAIDYVLKPFKLSLLMPVLARALDLRRLRVENEELQQRERGHLRKLEAANKELDAFSYSISHDLRAPLRAIQGFAQILLEDHTAAMSTDARECAMTIVKGAQRMAQLIDDLLRLSQLSLQPLEKRNVDMGALTHEVLQDILTDPKNGATQTLIGTLPAAMADSGLVRQVLFNLLANAFKFTRNRSQPLIEIGGRVEGEECVYFVKDNGAGFDMRQVEKLFGVFQRLHATREFEGTGIGLSIAHRIIERHGGRIWAQGEVDRGAVFHFTLPCM